MVPEVCNLLMMLYVSAGVLQRDSKYIEGLMFPSLSWCSFPSRSGRRKTMMCFLIFAGFACMFTMFLPKNSGKYVVLPK